MGTELSPCGLPDDEQPEGIQVIGAGWGRTGTMSLKEALDELGLPCYHMKEVFRHKDHSQKWVQAAQGQPVLKQLLSGYKATADWPAVTFYKELMELYPNAKVVLTVRDPDKWYSSAAETIWAIHKAWKQLPWYAQLLQRWTVPWIPHFDMIDMIAWEGDLQGCFGQDPAKSKQLFKQHNEEVIKVVPADRLLVFEVSQGWGPLCDFLGKPVPDKPFPNINERQQWHERIVYFNILNAVMTYGIPAVVVALLAVVLGAVNWCMQRSGR